MTDAVIYRKQSIDLRSKSMDWLLYDNGPRHERVKNSCRQFQSKKPFHASLIMQSGENISDIKNQPSMNE